MRQLTIGFNVSQEVTPIASQARTIEALGYGFIGVGEHLMMGNPPSVTAMAIPALAVAAGATSTIRLLSSVSLLPIYPPALLAKLVSTLDIAAGGRFIFGIGIGGESIHEFRAAGIPVNERGRRTDEILTILRLLWTEKNVSYQGRYYSVDDVTINPPPPQSPHTPIWVAGRKEAAMKRAALLGQGWLPYMYNAARYRSSVETIKRIADENGRDLSHFTWGHHQHVLIGNTREEAFARAVDTFGYSSGRSVDGIINDYWLCGSASDVIEGIHKLRDAGVETLSVLCPLREHSEIMEQAHRFAEEVMPAFR